MSKNAPTPEDLAVLRNELIWLNSQDEMTSDQAHLLEMAKNVSIDDEVSVKMFITLVQSVRAEMEPPVPQPI